MGKSKNLKGGKRNLIISRSSIEIVVLNSCGDPSFFFFFCQKFSEQKIRFFSHATLSIMSTAISLGANGIKKIQKHGVCVQPEQRACICV